MRDMTHRGASTPVAGPTETIDTGHSGQSESSRRRSLTVSRLNASSSSSTGMYSRRYIQWNPSDASRPIGRSLRSTARASTLFLAWESSSSVSPSRIAVR